MKSRKNTGRALPRRRISIALKILALLCVAFVALLLLLPHPPDIESGGQTTVIKRIPDLRDTVDPLARAKTPEAAVPLPLVPLPSMPSPPAPQPLQQDEPRIVLAPPEPAPPAPARKPENTAPAAPSSQLDQSPGPPALPQFDIARLPPEPAPAPAGRVDLPSKSDIREWVKSQAWEFLGGVDELGNILYRFEVWLDAPSDTLSAIKSVSYEYDAPSATPPSRDSDLSKGGFRVRFGGLSCAQKVTVILTMIDGRSRRAVVDGCRALN